MREFKFTEEEVKAIEHDRYHHPDPRVQRYMEILWLKHHDFDHDTIAKLAGCSRSTVQRTLSTFLDGGLQAVRQILVRESHCELDPFRDSLEDYFTKNPPRSLKEARRIIEEQTGITRSLSQVSEFLHSLGMKPRKVAAIPIPPKSTLEEHVKTQNEFKEEKLEPRLEEARQGKRQVLFVDAAHFVFAPFLGFLWCVARMCVRAPHGRKRFNVLGALDCVSHKLIQVTNHSYINSVSVCQLLRAVADAAVPGVPVTLILDNARYQKCALVTNLAKELGIELMYLPSYSPNLNLIERVWKFVKGECLYSTTYDNYEGFHTAIQQCLDDLPNKHKEAMNTLLTHKFQDLGKMPLIAA